MHYVRLNIIVGLVSLLVVAPIAWWTLDRVPPFEILGADPTPNPAHLGDVVDVGWIVRVDRQGCTVEFTRSVVDAHGGVRLYTPLRSSYGTLPIGVQHMHTVQPFTVPLAMPPGDMQVFVKFDIRCNPIHRLWPIEYMSPPAIVHVIPLP